MEFRFRGRAGDGGPRRLSSSSPPSRPRDRRFTPRVGPEHFHGGPPPPPPPPPQVEWEAAARREQIIREEMERRIIEEEVERRLVARARHHGGFGPEPFLGPGGAFVPPPPGPFWGVDVPVPFMPPPMPVGMHPNGLAPASIGPWQGSGCSDFGRQRKPVVEARSRPLPSPKQKPKPLKVAPNKSSEVLSSEAKVSNAKSKVESVTGTIITSEASISGLKRKADVTVAATEPTKSQRAAHDWSCALCQVRTTGEASLKTHLEGRKHMVKLAQFQCGVIKATTGNKDSEHPTEAPRKISILVDGEMHQVVQKSNHLWCERCRVRCESNLSMADHLRGKKHSELNKLWKSIKAARLNKSEEGSAATCRMRVNENGPVEVHEEVKKETSDKAEEVNENSITKMPVEITEITSEVNTNNHIEIPVQTEHEDTDMEGK